jgi:hypothetical protein
MSSILPTKHASPEGDLNLAKELSDQYIRDHSNISSIRNTWEDKEAMLLGVPLDSQSKKTKSQVFDPRLSTIVYERAARVCAQTPTGKVQALTKADAGKNQMMNLILTRYVYPNAKTQYDLLTKSRLLDVYSNVYGSFGWLVDYMVRDDYIGPDVQLIPIRNIIPQSGKHNDLDYIFVRSVVSKKWLLGRDTQNWKNIDVLLAKSGGKSVQDTDYQSYNETKFDSQSLMSAEKDDFEQIEIITRYEGDRWITFSKDAKVILRDMENPQGNGKLPVIMKHAFPLIDRFFGLGEFERGQSLQMAINSLINLYLDGVKMSIFPPLKIYLPDVVAKTLSYEPAAKWILKNNNPNAITEMGFSPQGIQSFNSTYQFLLAAMSNQAGTTDTTIGKDTDITQGKTPQALSMMANRENSRDNWDRFMLEKSLEETFDRFVDLIATRQEKPIKLNLFADEMKMIQETNPDLGEMYESGKYGEVTIKPTDLSDKKKGPDGKETTTKYRFFIDSGTSMKKDDGDQNVALTNIMEMVFKMPGAVEQAMHMGTIVIGKESINFGELLKRWITTSGVGESDKIISQATPEQTKQMQEMMQQLAAAQQPQEKAPAQPAPKEQKTVAETLNYKDAPDDVKREIEQQAGLQPSRMGDAHAQMDLLAKAQGLAQTHMAIENPQQQMGPDGQPAQQDQAQGQPGQSDQSINFEDPQNQAMLQGGQPDPVAEIMSQLHGAANGNSSAVQ